MPSGDDDHAAVRAAFREAVNMPPADLARWLETAESRSVGWQHEGESESVGHQAGRRILEILRKRQADLGEAEYAHMRKVVGYVHRHLAQGGPAADVAGSRWRQSLMNWGHDPLKR